MTNYNERLDELMPCDCKFLKGFAWRKGDPCEGCINGMLKQATTSLFKELVADAKPSKKHVGDEVAENRSYTGERLFNATIDEFEQNLLKALEELEYE